MANDPSVKTLSKSERERQELESIRIDMARLVHMANSIYGSLESKCVALSSEREEGCEWEWDDYGYFLSKCGSLYCFQDEFSVPRPAYIYCPGCGRKIKVKAREENE